MADNQITLTLPPLTYDPTIGGQLVCSATGASWQRITFSGLVEQVVEGGGPGWLIAPGTCVIPSTTAPAQLTIKVECSPTGQGGPYQPSAVIWGPGPLVPNLNLIQAFDAQDEAYPPKIIPYPGASPVQPPPAPSSIINLLLYYE